MHKGGEKVSEKGEDNERTHFIKIAARSLAAILWLLYCF